jgi:hypothetical protein
MERLRVAVRGGSLHDIRHAVPAVARPIGACSSLRKETKPSVRLPCGSGMASM